MQLNFELLILLKYAWRIIGRKLGRMKLAGHQFHPPLYWIIQIQSRRRFYGKDF